MLLDKFDAADIDMFKGDFHNVLVLLLTLQDRIEHYDDDIKVDIKEFKEGLERFDKKYPGLNIRLEGKTPSLRFFKIYFKSSSLQKTFKDAIQNMRPQKLAKTLTGLHSSNELKDISSVTNTLAVLFTENESVMLRLSTNGVKLVYSVEELLNDKNNPSLDLCTFYALKTKPKRNIKVFSEELIGKGNYTHQFIPKGSKVRKFMRS